MKNFFLAGFFLLPFVHSAQLSNVGIDTTTPDPSALLEISSTALPNNGSSTAKKGFLPPRVALTSTTDAVTIKTPAVGLLVFNTANAGVFPNEVTANQYYYWVGDRWERLVYRSTVEEAVKPRVFYIESSVGQFFTPSQINGLPPDGTPSNNLVTFESAILNTNNFITFNPANSTFRATVSGIYEVSAFVNYNPMANGRLGYVNDRAFLNLKIQISTNNGTTWTDAMGSRTAWGEGASSTLQTALLLGTPIHLNQNNMIRVVIANPFGPGASNDHGYNGQSSFISADPTNHIPVAKALRIQLLDYNIK